MQFFLSLTYMQKKICDIYYPLTLQYKEFMIQPSRILTKGRNYTSNDTQAIGDDIH